MKFFPLAALAAVTLGGCGAGPVTVAPASAPVADNFSASWQIESRTHEAIECSGAGATTVDLDLVNADSGQRFIYTFPCAAHQGTSGTVDVGRFDVLVNLTDGNGGVIAQRDLGAENGPSAGTLDLGHLIFTLP